MLKRSLKALLVMAIAVAAVDACARATAVTVAPGASLPPGSTITVIGGGDDPANVQGQLERLLLLRGYKVMSEGASRTLLEGTARTTNDSSSTTSTASISAVRRVRSAFVLRYSYRTRAGLGTSDVFETFTATISDLRSGAIVAAADFSQGGLTGKQVGTVLQEFVDKLPQPTP
jgi:hypothetical protein